MRRALFGALMTALLAGGAGEALARAPAPAPVRAPARPRPRLGDLRARIDKLDKQLASLGAHSAQLQNLHVQVIRIRQVLARLERAAEAPRTLAAELDKVRRRIAELAQRVERVRLEKVRVAYEKAELRAPGGVNLGYDEGFFVASGNGRYRLQMNGILRFTGRGGQAVGNAALLPVEKVHLLGLNVPNGFLQFSGNIFTKKLTFLVELDFGDGYGVLLNDFALSLRTCPYFGITVGQFLVGFAQQQAHDPYDTIFVDTSPAALTFGPRRGIGLKLHFYQWKDRIFQELGVFNGAGINSGGNDDTSFMYVGRVGIMPLGPVPDKEGDLRTGGRPVRLRVATGYLFQPMPSGRDLDGKDGMDSIFLHQLSAELTFVAAGFSFNGEFFYRLEDHGKAVTLLSPAEKQRRPFFGGYAQAAYTFKRVWLQPTVRYSYTEPVAWWRVKDGDMAYGWTSPVPGAEEVTADGTRALLPESVHELTVGLNWYVFEQHVKVLLNYTYLWERGYEVAAVTGKVSRQVHLGSLLIQGRF